MFMELRKKIKIIINKIFNNLESFLEKKPKLLNGLVLFFDKTSKVTSVLLFDVRVFFTLLSVGFGIFFINTDSLMILADYFRTLGISYITVKYAFKHILSWDVIIFLLFLCSLMEIVVLNMFLIALKPIKHKMVTLYGDNVVKQRGYNAPNSSLIRTVAIGSGCLFGYCADLIVKDREVAAWRDVCKDELEAATKADRSPVYPEPPYKYRQVQVTGHVEATVEKN